ncbi:hypothetical protein VTN00DRAFT_560 [Thermoascus crustaceus]|uniref:uncharacterized protein n=1 Tax=Thermoascus crustaceus TaxID=5088 RepID=UPI0037444B3D
MIRQNQIIARVDSQLRWPLYFLMRSLQPLTALKSRAGNGVPIPRQDPCFTPVRELGVVDAGLWNNTDRLQSPKRVYKSYILRYILQNGETRTM